MMKNKRFYYLKTLQDMIKKNESMKDEISRLKYRNYKLLKQINELRSVTQ
tara:strand:- start:1121 stop:1270 length:150 start_codon:yes stop_codon:yes gene_type:complete